MKVLKMLWNGFESSDWLRALWNQTLSGNFEAGELEIASEADVIILNWLKEKPGVAYARQVELLEAALAHGIPTLIFDQEGIHDEGGDSDPRVEQAMFESAKIPMRLTMPAFYPPYGYETLHYAYPFRQQTPIPLSTCRLYQRSYVGYCDTRYGQALDWFRDLQGDIWGDWLDDSQEQTLIDFGVGPRFHDECQPEQVQTVLQRSVSTVHLGTPEQCSYGMLTLRYAEAAASGTLAFVPWETQLPPFWKYVFTSDEDIWRMDLEKDTNHTQKYLLTEMQNQQQLVVHEAMSHYAWAKVINELTGGQIT